MTSTRPAGAFVVRALRAADREIERALPRVLAQRDAEAVHDLRVGIRRMRVLLKLARPVFGRFHADAVRAAYTVVHRSTGELRDAEVLDETMRSLGVKDAAFEAWLSRRGALEARLRRAVVRGLGAGQLAAASKLLHALLTLPIDPRRDATLARFAKAAVKDGERRVRALEGTPVDDVAGLHALRIAYKGLRYASEILAPALAPERAALAAPAARFQKRLGTIHDLDVALVVVARARSLPQADKAALHALLAAARGAAVEKYLAEPPLSVVLAELAAPAEPAG